MTKKLFLTCMRAAILLAILVGSAHADLNLANGYATGQWYNPARDGEGFFVEIIGEGDNLQISLAMYSYDAEGNQLWLVGNAAIANGDIGATVPVFLIEGPVWGTGYDPDDRDTTQFGTIAARFPTCDSALFSVQSNVAGLESGSYSEVRLTEIVGMNCVEPPPSDSPDPPEGGVTSGMWRGELGESVVCFFVNEEGTKIIETDECDQGKAFSAEINGVEIDIDGHQNPDACVASVICDAAWPIEQVDDASGVSYMQLICPNEAGGIGQVIFDTESQGRARAYEGLDPDQASGRMCYGPDVPVFPVQQ